MIKVFYVLNKEYSTKWKDHLDHTEEERNNNNSEANNSKIPSLTETAFNENVMLNNNSQHYLFYAYNTIKESTVLSNLLFY